MRQEDQDELFKYLRAMADEVGLRDWRFEMVIAPEQDMPKGSLTVDTKYVAYGVCSPTIGQQKAFIYFHNEFKEDLDPEEQREVVIHELVHCHMIDMREFIRSGFLNQVTQSTYDALNFGFDLAWEHATDQIARNWAFKLPLIEWPPS